MALPLLIETHPWYSSISCLFWTCFTVSECCAQVWTDGRDLREHSEMEISSMGPIHWIMQAVKVILSVGQPVPGQPSGNQRCVCVDVWLKYSSLVICRLQGRCCTAATASVYAFQQGFPLQFLLIWHAVKQSADFTTKNRTVRISSFLISSTQPSSSASHYSFMM